LNCHFQLAFSNQKLRIIVGLAAQAWQVLLTHPPDLGGKTVICLILAAYSGVAAQVALFEGVAQPEASQV
jgi:hypothetical protein